MSIDILKKQIKEDKLQNVYLFYGAEEYLIKYYINTIMKAIVNDEYKDFNYIYLDGKTDVDTIISNCETLPMFCDKKLVIAKNSGLFKSKKGSTADSGTDKKTTKDKLSEYIEKIPAYSCLIFVETDIDKRLKLVSAIKKQGLIVELAYQKPVDLVKWVIKVFKSYNKTIEQLPASFLVENSEYSMTELLNEIEKVVHFVGDKNQITINDIEVVCNKSIKSKIFDLTDAVSAGNISKALILLNDMSALKEPMQKVLFMIIRQIRMLYRIKLLRQTGLKDDLVAKQMGLTPYVASKIMSMSRNMDINMLEKAMYYGLELDEAIKIGKMTDRIAIELLIASMGSTK